MNRLLIRLWGVMDGEDPESINYRIAKILVENIATIKHTSSTALAKMCNVSKPSMSRFCKNLGYDDFYVFRAELSQYIPDRGVKYVPQKEYSHLPWYDQYLCSLQDSIDRIRSEDILNTIEELARDIHDYPKVYLAGNMQSGHTAESLHYNLHVVKKDIQAVTSFKNQIDIFESGSIYTLFVIFSASGEYFRALFPAGQIPEQAKSSKVWLVTTNPAMKHMVGVDRILNLSTGDSLPNSNICLEMAANMIAYYYWNHCRD